MRFASCLFLVFATATPAWAQDEPTPEPTPEAPAVDVAAPRPVRPWVAGALGLLVPGAGHFVQHETATGLGFVGTEAGLFSLGLVAVVTTPQTCTTPPSPGCDPDLDVRRLISRAFIPFTALQDIHLVGAYDAYRIARIRHGPDGYRYPAPQSDLRDLAGAPFRWRNLRRPVFWVPLLVGGTIGVLLSQLDPAVAPLWERSRVEIWGRSMPVPAGVALGETMYASTFWTVAAGEEAFFRGMLQTGLVEWLGPVAGIITASLIFGAAHYFNFVDDPQMALLAVAYTGSLGAYLGTLAFRDGNDLQTPVALHFWYDLLVASAVFVLQPDDQLFTAHVGFVF